MFMAVPIAEIFVTYEDYIIYSHRNQGREIASSARGGLTMTWGLFQEAAAHHEQGEGEEDGDKADDDGKARMTHYPRQVQLDKMHKRCYIIR